MADDACDAAQTGDNPAPPRDGGFTLLEVLVAFIILSLPLVALLRGGADGLAGVRAAGRMEDAVAIARSHLSAFDALAAPTGKDLQGDEGGGYHWRLHVTPLGSVPASGGGRERMDPTSLYQVSVTISWQAGSWQAGSWRVGGRERSVHLETQRLTPVPP